MRALCYHCLLLIGLVWYTSPYAALGAVESDYQALIKKQWQDAYEYWVPAAEKGNARARYYLSMLFSRGWGVELDEEVALTLLMLSAESGFPPAQYRLGSSYQQGALIEPDAKRARSWWARAAEQGLVIAQLKLAALYALGRGVDQDLQQAIRWYRRAAESGSPQAMAVLARLGDTGFDRSSRMGLLFDDSAELSQLMVLPGWPVLNVTGVADGMDGVSVGSDEWGEVRQSLRLNQRPIPQNQGPDRDIVRLSTGHVGGVRHPSQTVVDKDFLDDLAWIARQPEVDFTLQLFSSDKRESAERVAASLKSDWRVIVFPFGRSGYRWYGVLAGSFDSLSKAVEAKNWMVRENAIETPWIRRFGSIRTPGDAPQ